MSQATTTGHQAILAPRGVRNSANPFFNSY